MKAYTVSVTICWSCSSQ